MKIHMVHSDSQWKDFVNIPFKLYKDIPHWSPVFHNDLRDQLHPKHSMYVGKNDFASFVVSKGKESLGRIACFLDPSKNIVYWGYYDSINSIEVGKLLLQEVTDWAHSFDVRKLVGPVEFDTFGSRGLLHSNYNTKLSVWNSYNFEYYNTILKHLGFEDIKSSYIGKYKLNTDWIVNIPEEKTSSINIRIPEKKKEFITWMNKAFELDQNQAAFPFAIGTARQKRIIDLSIRDYGVFAFNQDHLIACMIAFPDYQQAIRRMKGKYLPKGPFQIWTSKKSHDEVNLFYTYMDSDYASEDTWRRLLKKLCEQLLKRNIKFLVYQEHENGYMSNFSKPLESQEYRLLEKNIGFRV